MEWVTIPFISAQDVFDYLKNDESYVEDETDKDVMLVQRLVESACRYAEQFTGGPIVNQVITEHLDGESTYELSLNYYPVISVSKVEEYNDGSYTDITDDIDFYEDGAIFSKGGTRFQSGRRKYKVTYEAGFGSSPLEIPADIKQAAIQLAAHLLRVDVQRYSRTMEEPTNLMWVSRVEYGAIGMLKPYRRVRVAFV